MIKQSNSNLSGFTPGIGWGSTSKPLIYLAALSLSQRLADEAVQASRRSWRVDTAMRRFRIATTEEELEIALQYLAIVVAEYSISKH